MQAETPHRLRKDGNSASLTNCSLSKRLHLTECEPVILSDMLIHMASLGGKGLSTLLVWLYIAIDAAGPIENMVGAVFRVAFLWLGLFGMPNTLEETASVLVVLASVFSRLGTLLLGSKPFSPRDERPRSELSMSHARSVHLPLVVGLVGL